jgi:hypothetical protein
MEGQSGWAEHAVFMDRLVEEGFIALGGPIGSGPVVMIAVEAGSEDEVRSTFSADPWSESQLLVDAIEPWTIRLDGRSV